jgi:hypothetical protein
MKAFPLAIQTVFSDLEQRVHDADFSEQFDPSGTFKRMKRYNKIYWYWTYRDGQKVINKYVGPVTDKQITDRVKRFSELKHDYDARRNIVRSLVAAGLPASDHMSGEIILAMCHGGFFRLRGILIGTAAYQCYSGILGVRLPAQIIKTQDADFAQFFAISNKIDDVMPSVLDILRTVDPTFRPVPHISGEPGSTAFINDSKYKVEFLTPNRGSADYEGKPAKMKALGGASAEPLRFLDFLIRDPIRSVILHGGGVPVTIPTPERYAVHKLIVAERRVAHFTSKIDKDISQSAQLIEAMWEKRAVDISMAWQEAWERGPSWRSELIDGASRLDQESLQRLGVAVKNGAARRRKNAAMFWPEAQLHLEV